MSSSNYNSLQRSRKEKMTQVALQIIQGTDPKSSSSSSSSGSSKSTPRNLNRAVRLAQLTGNAMLGALNLAQATTNFVGGHLIDAATSNNVGGQQDNNQEEVISIHSSQPVSVSSETPPITVHSSEPTPFPTPSSLPVPTSPSPSRRTSRSSSKSFEGAYPRKRQ